MKQLIYWLVIFILAVFAWHWGKASLVEPKPALYIEYNVADLNKDGVVNLIDQAIMAANWGKHEVILTYTDANNPQGLPVYYVPDMPAEEFERILK